MGKSLWGYVTGEEAEPELSPENTTEADLKAWKAWNEKDKKVMFLISQNVSNSMIGHIQELNSAKEAWDALEKLYTTNTRARKIQLKNELNNMKKSRGMSVNDYVLKIKEVADALGSIGASVHDDDLVSTVLNGLTDDEKWKPFATSVYVRENLPDFDDLVSLMIIEERNIGGSSSEKGSAEQAQAFYSGNGRGRGRSYRGRGAERGSWQNNQNQISESTGRGRGRQNQRGRGSFRGRGGSQQQGQDNTDGCWNCGKSGHYAKDCWSNTNNSRRGRGQQGNYANSNTDERLFVMQRMMTATAHADGPNDVWYVDSGASNHMTHHKNWFNELHVPEQPGYVETGDDTVHPIEHVGNVPLAMHDGKPKYMADVLHVPTITKNLVSVGQMVEQGLQVKFNSNGCFVEDPNNRYRMVAKGKRIGRMFTLDVEVPARNDMLYTQKNAVITDIDIWHKRIGHVNVQRLKTMQSQNVVTGLPNLQVSGMQKVCEACQLGKQARHAFPHEKHVSKRPLELIHSDVWGPTKNTSLAGSQYYVTFVDDHTRKVWIYFMKSKSEVFGHFKSFKNHVEKETGMQIKCLRSDGGGEYFSHEFSRFLDGQGVKRQFTCRYTPQQNGVAERKNRHIAEISRALMSEKEMPQYYWAEAVHTAVYIMNRTPTAAVHDVTPEEKFTGLKADVSHFKVFGCIAYVRILDELRTKLDP